MGQRLNMQGDEKRVKFSGVETKEIVSDEYEDMLENDLDLDTVRTKAKSKGIKNVEYSDEDDDEDADAGVDVDGEKKEMTDRHAEEQTTKDIDWDSDTSDTSNAATETFDSADDRQVPMEPFSLHGDREEGRFDADGFYIRTVDEDADQDRWMANLARSDIVQARQAHERKLQTDAEAARRMETATTKLTDGDIYRELLTLLRPGQCVLDAIRANSTVAETRRNGASVTTVASLRPPLNKNRLKKMQAASDATPTEETDDNRRERRRIMDRITELSAVLMERGHYDVHEETYEVILHKTEQSRMTSV